MINQITKHLQFFVFLFFLFLTETIGAQNFNRGVNVSNWFQAVSAREVQFTTFTKKDFEQIKFLGADVIRLPINLHYMTNGAPEYKLDPLFLNMLDQVVDWAEELQIHLILDNHTFDPAVSTSPDVIDPLKKTWAQMAQHYKNRSNYVYYEILNEPHGIASNVWAQIQQQVIDTIRVHDGQHYIVVGGVEWNSYTSLAALPVYTDDKLIYTFHFYDPFIFTHQGATWGTPIMASLAAVPFPYGTSPMPATPNDLKGTWVEGAINNYINDGTINRVRQLIDIAVAFKAQRNVPVFCGEMGVYIPNSNNTDRLRWYEVVRTYMEQKDIPWTMWDYKGGFGLFEKNSGERYEYDLNVGLLEKLNFYVPPQQEYVKKPETKSRILYDDYLGKDVYNVSYRNAGSFDFYSPNAATGDYCLCWNGVAQYDAIALDLRPDLDFSKLSEHDFELSFKVKSTATTAKFDVRLMDTKTGPNDRPWRMGKTIDNTVTPFNGQWQEVRIPLKALAEMGAWDGAWFNPQGLFDWTNIDKLEIVAEHHALTGIKICYDDIKIEGEEIEEVITSVKPTQRIAIYPNPFTEGVTIDYKPETTQTDVLIYNQLGVLIRQFSQSTFAGEKTTLYWDGTTENGLRAGAGIYLVRIKSGDTVQVEKVLAR